VLDVKLFITKAEAGQTKPGTLKILDGMTHRS